MLRKNGKRNKASHFPYGAVVFNSFGDELSRTSRNLRQGAMKCVVVGRAQNVSEPTGEIKRVRRQLFIDCPSGGGKRKKGFAHIGAVCAPCQQFAFLQRRYRTRHFSLVHMGGCANRLPGKNPNLS